jgi:threonine synthase
VVLATGHPAKEAALIKEVTGQNIPIPEHLRMLQKKTDPIAVIEPQLDAFEGAIASCF